MTGALSQNVAYKNKLLIFCGLTAFILSKIIYRMSNICDNITHSFWSRVNVTYYSISALNKCQGTSHNALIV